VVTLRFAKDSPDIPVAEAGGADTRTAGANPRTEGRTVTYEFRDPWALFRLLAAYVDQNAEYGATDAGSPVMLRFVIPTASDVAHAKAQGPLKTKQEIRVFARLRFYIPGTKEPREMAMPPFPESAPVIRGIQATGALN
jgi:hypothetical protein